MRRDPSSGRFRAARRRERARRHLTLAATAALLLLGTGPVVGHHLARIAPGVLAGVDHIGALCVTALQLVGAPIHGVFHVVLAGGLLRALYDRARAWQRLRRSLAGLEAEQPAAGAAFWRAALDAGLDPARVRIVAGLPSPAFTAGMLAPRVYVAAELAVLLDARQLAAVLAHERAHVARRDPLRLSALRGVVTAFAWIPGLRRLADELADQAEILADDDAASATNPLVLASALLALARWPRAVPAGELAVGATGEGRRPDLLERRVRRLLGERVAPENPVRARSLLGAALALTVVWTSGVLAATPLPEHAIGRHCDHRAESVVAHLLCREELRRLPPNHCVHQTG
jgi:Zn-dependent protease with chaperone function